ncbi:hypothetical protein HYW55_05030 [Candidatus Gottesmanbacteria bacterium]|nr:hypothetical protein [Candidatus Gottesmanbacteria bacterium]
MRYRLVSILVSVLFFSILFSTPLHAAKKFVKKQSASKSAGGAIPAIVKYRSDKLGLLFSFSNFRGIESVSYSFSYTANGIPQGAGGTITAGNNPSMQRELLFGTCSTGVCTYHYNLSGARLILTAKLTNGKTVTKSYRIKTYQ